MVVRSIRQGSPSRGFAGNIRQGTAPVAPAQPGRSLSNVRGDDSDNGGDRSSLSGQLASAQGELQSTLDTRLQEEIRLLTTRYSGDTVQAERVAKARAERGFAASDPDFAATIAPLQQKVSDLEEQIRKAAQRRSTRTIGGNGGETLG